MSKIYSVMNSFVNEFNTVEPDFGTQALPLTLPEKPLQNNSTDCGVFLLHYAELLLKDFHLYLFPGQYTSLENWFNEDSIANKRFEIAKIIMDVSKDLSALESVSFPIMRFSSLNNEVAEVDVRLIDPDLHVKHKFNLIARCGNSV